MGYDPYTTRYLAPPKTPKRTGPIIAIVFGAVVVAIAVVVTVAMVVWHVASPNSTPVPTPASSATSQEPSQEQSLEPTESSYTGGITPTILWAQKYGGLSYNFFNGVAVASDGSIVAVGDTNALTSEFGDTNGSQTAMIAMFDGQGNIVWAKTMSQYDAEEFKAVAIGQDGSIYAVGSSIASDKGSVVAKLTPTGDIVWVNTFGGKGIDIFWDVVADGDGIIVVGYTDSKDGDMPATHGGLDALMAKITPDGDVTWEKTFGGSKDDVFYSVTVGLDGTIVAAGFSGSQNGNFADPRLDSNAIIAGFSDDGALLWSKVFGGNDLDLFNAISTAPDGSYFVAGGTWSKDGDWPTKGDGLRAVFGACSPDMAQCQWNLGPSGDFYGAAVTTGGVGVAGGGDSSPSNWIMGVTNLNTGDKVSGQAVPNQYTHGTYQGLAALPDNQVVAVGCTEMASDTDSFLGDVYAVIVVLAFQ